MPDIPECSEQCLNGKQWIPNPEIHGDLPRVGVVAKRLQL